MPAQPFGKRNRARAASRQPPLSVARAAAAASPDVPSTDQEAVFAAAWREVEMPEACPKRVPRSFRAAMLAGLVVAFCLSGLDVTKAVIVDPVLDPLLKASGMFGASGQALPAMIALSVLSGARTAATTLLIAHRVLRSAGQSSHLAYAVGGAAAATAWAGMVVLLLGHAPAHGWGLEIAAGAGAGFFYRMFAGATRG